MSYRRTPRISSKQWIAALAVLALSFGCAALGPAAPQQLAVERVDAVGPLRAGAAAVEITPEDRVWMGGYGFLRRSRGVHDPLYARALVLETGGLQLALVSLDIVGLQYGDRRRLDPQLEALGFDPRFVLVHATHNHSGPDTIGIWGLPPIFSGQSDAVMQKLESGLLEALRQARDALRPAELASAAVPVLPSGFYRNLRRPGLVDPNLALVHLREAGGGPSIATLVELGCHPEALPSSNRLVTADFPGVAVRRIEQSQGGVGIYVSGALGGLVSPDLREAAEPFDEAARIGERLADAVLDALPGLGAHDPAPGLTALRAPLLLRNENWRYRLLQRRGILDRRLYRGNYVLSEVNLWAIGALRVATVPGEMTPDLGLRAIENAGGRPTLLLGLANDQIGYLLPEDDWDGPLFRYERTVSPGPGAGERVLRTLEDLARVLRAAP